ncbi:TPA: hypothetical protein N0F65_008121 [Lagenidium giganteum]|uniref:Uncharacterized protein n=1 Tax=Lagenidium giganteum TaxID=4803 RepID=A0AAV2Z3C1_9STRA|nr:TPA: hypothetical protein N0F65_008121 [Lagenidium giganteum]
MMLATAAASQLKRPCAAVATRSFFNSASVSAMPQVAVDEEFPGVPRATPVAAKAGKTTVSTAASGLKLASDNSESLVSTLGVQIAAGSRYESDETAGLAHLFSKMAFRATEARSDLRLYREVEAIGGVISTSAGRDAVRYNISVLPEHASAAAEILAETTLAPRFAYWDIALQKEKVKIDVENLAACAEASVLEGVHAAAFYDDVTLGRPQFTTENLAKFGEDDLWKFYEQYVNSANIALVASGLEHSALTDIANSHFSGVAAGAPVAHPAAKYVGGESRVKKASKLTHVALGFQTAGANCTNYGASQVLKALLQLRAGKKNVKSFLASYEDVGVVGLAGAVAPNQAGALVDSFVAEIKQLASAAPSSEELAAAKNIANSEAAAALDSREGRVAVLGKLALTQSQFQLPSVAISAVSAKAVQELAQKAVASRPSLASVGQLASVPRIDAVAHKLK